MVLLAWVAILFLALAMFGLARRVSFADGGGFGGGIMFDAIREALVPTNPHVAALVLFVQAGCRACDARLSELVDKFESLPDELEVVLIFDADKDPGVGPLNLGSNSARSVPLEAPLGLGQIGVLATPYAAVVAASGHLVGEGPIGSRDELEGFVDRAILETIRSERRENK